MTGYAMLFDLQPDDPMRPFEVAPATEMFLSNPSMVARLLEGRLTYQKRLSPVINYFPFLYKLVKSMLRDRVSRLE